jgi:hypothetical protein
LAVRPVRRLTVGLARRLTVGLALRRAGLAGRWAKLALGILAWWVLRLAVERRLLRVGRRRVLRLLPVLRLLRWWRMRHGAS